MAIGIRPGGKFDHDAGEAPMEELDGTRDGRSALPEESELACAQAGQNSLTCGKAI